MPQPAGFPDSSSPSPLLAALHRLLHAHRPAIGQERLFYRMQALLFGHLCFARRTVTQALLALGLTDHDWSSFYRLFNEPRLDYEVLTECFLRETLTHVSETEPYVVVVDGVQVPRHSQKMPGTSWLKNPRTPPFKPGIHRAQRFLHLASLLPRTEEGYSRALPLRWEPAFPEKAVLPEGMEPRKEWEAARDALRWLRTELDAAGRTAQQLLALGDGGFCVADLFRELPHGSVLMARCARNRNLYEVPGPEKERRRGPKRKYGDKARKPHQWLSEKSGWRRAEFMVRGREVRPRHRVEGPFVLEKASECPVFLIAVKGHRRSGGGRRRVYRKPGFFLVSATWDGERWAMPFVAEELLATGWMRWEVELLHREIKTGFGLGEIQCWSRSGAILAVR